MSSSNENTFIYFVGSGLANKLPYHKKGLFGPKVCEAAAVFPMTTAGFFLGASLSLASEKSSAQALEAVEWPTGTKDQFIENLKSNFATRVSNVSQNGDCTFEMIFPETVTVKEPNTLVNQDGCITAIGQRVMIGMIFGIQYPILTEKMLKNWIKQPESSRRLAIGGLSVNEKPLVVSVDQSKGLALSLFENWKSQK